ncbi:MAG: hypothetical protein ACON5F_07400 [Jejuia sp.]
MKSFFFGLLVLVSLFITTSCSSSDGDTMQEQQQEQLEGGLANLTINGIGLNNFNVVVDRASLIDEDDSVRIDITNNEGYRIIFTVAKPIIQKQYTMITYNNTMDNISSMSIPVEGIFLSKAGGTLTITNITTAGEGTTYLGNFNVDYDRQDNSPGDINVTGTFEITANTDS